MIIVRFLLAAVISTVLLLLFGILLIVPIAGTSTGAGATAGVLSINASGEATTDIPALLLPIYVSAASECDGLPWTVIAGIGKVESDHGRYGGSVINPDGRVLPPIIGIRLDGTNDTAVITDTDGGALDGDTEYDRAVGPFQFIPGSWAIYGKDGNDDGFKDPHNVYDAVPAAVAHLCPNGSIDDIEAAIFTYNRSNAYVADVLAWSARYTGAVVAVPVAGYALPIAGMTEAQATRPHHDYPAIDVGVGVGTPTFAMVDGTIAVAISAAGVYDGGSSGKCGNTVIVDGVDSVRYTYCHLSAVNVTSGQSVTAGQQLGLTGGQPGQPGAGNTTGPHLHLGLHGQGRQLCPQPVILAIIKQTPINPLASPSGGCITGLTGIDWDSWITHNVVATNEPNTVGPPLPDNAQRFTFISRQTKTQTATSYMDLTWAAPPDQNWASWASHGEMLIGYVVTSTPTDAPLKVQLCFWRHAVVQFQEETCSPQAITITGPGTYVASLGTPTDWWQKGGNYSWSRAPSVIRIMHKTPQGRLPMTASCGSYCTYGPVSQWVPVTADIEVWWVPPS